MKLTENQIRRIVRKVIAEQTVSHDDSTHFIEIPDISALAENSEMSIDSLLSLLESAAKRCNLYSEGYSDEYDSFLVEGTEQNIERFALLLDDKLGGSAGSSEQGFGNLIERM